MSYSEVIDMLAEDPEQLEQAYHEAVKAGEADAFKLSLIHI